MVEPNNVGSDLWQVRVIERYISSTRITVDRLYKVTFSPPGRSFDGLYLISFLPCDFHFRWLLVSMILQLSPISGYASSKPIRRPRPGWGIGEIVCVGGGGRLWGNGLWQEWCYVKRLVGVFYFGSSNLDRAYDKSLVFYIR